MTPLIPIIAAAAVAGAAYELVFKEKTAPGTPAKDDPNAVPKFKPGVIDTPTAGPTSPSANAVAHLTQPQPPDQPPLPPCPPPTALPAGAQAIVSTKETGQAGALRVRATPSTTGKAVAGGEPASGGGFEHLSTIQITGPMTAGFCPVTGTSRNGSTISGFGWAGYLKPIGGATITGESDFGDDFGYDRDRIRLRGRHGMKR
jgi:hypothetical protein